jgi:hypothetical protein
MFNIDETQGRIIRVTVASAFAYWLVSQIGIRVSSSGCGTKPPSSRSGRSPRRLDP